jgi:N-acetylglutamate synthase-like GNAT family acetyltransferase
MKGSEQSPDEAKHQHFAFFDEQAKILGVGRLDLIDHQTAQIRFMAVDQDVQNNGIGKSLMLDMELAAKASGVQEIILHAREIALPFYDKLGYQLVEKSHLLFGEIQHFLMRKKL